MNSSINDKKLRKTIVPTHEKMAKKEQQFDKNNQLRCDTFNRSPFLVDRFPANKFLGFRVVRTKKSFQFKMLRAKTHQ